MKRYLAFAFGRSAGVRSRSRWYREIVEARSVAEAHELARVRFLQYLLVESIQIMEVTS